MAEENRAIAATSMSSLSSRAHTITQINLTQRTIGSNGTLESELNSKINLVDLAGSERSSTVGATGDRLAEGANINKSLSSIGQVI